MRTYRVPLEQHKPVAPSALQIESGTRTTISGYSIKSSGIFLQFYIVFYGNIFVDSTVLEKGARLWPPSFYRIDLMKLEDALG